MLEIPRRQLITGLISFVAAPAIVRISSIMPVKSMDDAVRLVFVCNICGWSYKTEQSAAKVCRPELHCVAL